MNNMIEILQLAQSLVKEHLDPSWSFSWNNRKTSFGVCKYRTKEIQLSSFHAARETMFAVEQTILHEIAHALTPYARSHGAEWQEQARKLGVVNPSASRHPSYEVKLNERFKFAIMYKDEFVKGYTRRPNPSTFDQVKGMWLRGRKNETYGKLEIVKL